MGSSCLTSPLSPVSSSETAAQITLPSSSYWDNDSQCDYQDILQLVRVSSSSLPTIQNPHHTESAVLIIYFILSDNSGLLEYHLLLDDSTDIVDEVDSCTSQYEFYYFMSTLHYYHNNYITQIKYHYSKLNMFSLKRSCSTRRSSYWRVYYSMCWGWSVYSF